MALAGTVIHEVRFGGSDSLNGGGFDPVTGTRDAVLTTTANTGNTATPEVSSANYNFVAGDVGHWLFIKSGTNWIPGWYQITSVASNKATVNAAIGAAILWSSVTNQPSGLNTVAGVATVATPTSGTWSIDYSQADAAAFALTSLTTAAANAIILTASATKAMVGNTLIVKSGTNFTTGYYTITAVSAGVSITVDRNCTSAAGASGTAGIGGGFATLGKCGSIVVASNIIFQKYNASVYSITSATANIAGGCFAPAVAIGFLTGYDTNRWVGNTDRNMPTNQASGISTATIIGNTSTFSGITRNIYVDGANLTSIKGFAGTFGDFFHCVGYRCTNNAFHLGASSAQTIEECLALSCITQTAFNLGSQSSAIWNAAINCTSVIGFTSQGSQISNSVASACGTGFSLGGGFSHNNLTAVANTSDGIVVANNANGVCTNSVAYGNTGTGFKASGRAWWRSRKCAGGSNSTIDWDTNWYELSGRIDLTADPFVNKAATINTIEDVWANFAPNNTAGGGALLRGAGTVPYQDVGAIQHQDSGSAGGLLRHPGYGGGVA